LSFYSGSEHWGLSAAKFSFVSLGHLNHRVQAELGTLGDVQVLVVQQHVLVTLLVLFACHLLHTVEVEQ
jgi:hypothetical protein